MSEITIAKGKKIILSEGREVFVGRSESDIVCIRFKNKEGKLTEFSLSEEAYDALYKLILIDKTRKIEFGWNFVKAEDTKCP